MRFLRPRHPEPGPTRVQGSPGPWAWGLGPGAASGGLLVPVRAPPRGRRENAPGSPGVRGEREAGRPQTPGGPGETERRALSHRTVAGHAAVPVGTS